MSEVARQLLEQIRALSDDDRRQIADELLGDGIGFDPFADPEWRAELDRRIAEMGDGNGGPRVHSTTPSA
jgi:Putative addiction module component